MIDKWELAELKRTRAIASAAWYEACEMLRDVEALRAKTYAAYKKADAAYAAAVAANKVGGFRVKDSRLPRPV